MGQSLSEDEVKRKIDYAIIVGERELKEKHSGLKDLKKRETYNRSNRRFCLKKS